jgi:hypothetical protein
MEAAYQEEGAVMKRTTVTCRPWNIRPARTISTAVLSLAFLGTLAAQNPVVNWNQIAVTAALNANQTLSPGSNLAGTAAIYLAYAHLAIFNAVNAIDRRFQSYGPDIVAPAGASPEAAAIAAAYYTLSNYLPDQSAYLATQYAASLAALPDDSGKTLGIQVGHDAANAIISLRSSDGRGASVPYSYPSVPTAGMWIPTPTGFLPPQAPWAGQMTPFTMSSASQFLPDEPPPDLSSAQWADDFNQVKALGAMNSSVRTPQQTEIGLFWTENTTRQYARAFRALTIAQDLSLSDSARLFAVLWTSFGDSIIGCFNAKYHFSFWRPVTAIQSGDIDGNPDTAPDPTWMPLGVTPNHPEYPAAHGCVTGSVANALKRFFRTPRVTLIVSSTATNTVHTFTSVDDLEKEVEAARIYAGFHYHHSLVHGFVLGHHVADQVEGKFFQPLSNSDR